MSSSPLESILRHAYGFWSSAILAAGLRHRVFDHIAAGATSAAELSSKASLSLRGSQAVLDGLVGLGLIEKSAGCYANSPQLSTYLLSTSTEYIGGYADMILATLTDWSHLPEAVASGRPLHRQESADPANTFWESLVRALAPLGFVPARAAAARLGVAGTNAFDMLDIGGGAGAYSVIWLGLNARGHCAQLDWPNVNEIARNYVSRFGYSNRFDTIDGDMEKVSIPDASYDYAVYSNVAHGLSADRNIAMFRRIKSWLRKDGTLVISSLVPSDERTGGPLLMMFSSNLLLNTEEGTTHLRCDYESWLREAGFYRIGFEPVIELPFTLIYAS